MHNGVSRFSALPSIVFFSRCFLIPVVVIVQDAEDSVLVLVWSVAMFHMLRGAWTSCHDLQFRAPLCWLGRLVCGAVFVI